MARKVARKVEIKKKRAFLLGPVQGNHPEEVSRAAVFYQNYLKEMAVGVNDLKIGIDGGTAIWRKWGWVPDFAVGDWDSLKSRSILKEIPHVTLEENKNRSDLFYAMVAAIEDGATEIYVMGVTGGRPDHHLAVLQDLSLFSSAAYGKLTQVQAIGPEGQYIFLSNEISRWSMHATGKMLVSVFPMSDQVSGVFLTGFCYPLENATLRPCSLGLSNVTQPGICEVRLRKGRLLIIIVENREGACGKRGAVRKRHS